MRKKREPIVVKIDELRLPNIGIAYDDVGKLKVKGTLPGQTAAVIAKRRREEARLVQIIEPAAYEIPPACEHSEFCGGCCFQTVTYEKQLELKEGAVRALFEEAEIDWGHFHGTIKSPATEEYRNKMEFSFGDTGKDGQLSLGMRRKHSYYEVVFVENCRIISENYRRVLRKTLEFFREEGLSYYNNRRAEGVLRHLVVRESKAFGDLLVNLVTTSGIADETVERFADELSADLQDVKIAGILHTVNDNVADTVKLDQLRIVRGQSYFFEQVCGLKFKITPESFFQTNTHGAEILYEKALSFAENCGTAFDLYSGTGTITQLLAKKAKRAIGIEIVPEAVESAKENARLNGIDNVEFICGDVLEKIAELEAAPDLIVLDPPREGIHPKAIEKIINFGAERVIYISCKPSSLVRDLAAWTARGYKVTDGFLVDMFPGCGHVECVVLMTRKSG